MQRETKTMNLCKIDSKAKKSNLLSAKPASIQRFLCEHKRFLKAKQANAEPNKMAWQTRKKESNRTRQMTSQKENANSHNQNSTIASQKRPFEEQAKKNKRTFQPLNKSWLEPRKAKRQQQNPREKQKALWTKPLHDFKAREQMRDVKSWNLDGPVTSSFINATKRSLFISENKKNTEKHAKMHLKQKQPINDILLLAHCFGFSYASLSLLFLRAQCSFRDVAHFIGPCKWSSFRMFVAAVPLVIVVFVSRFLCHQTRGHPVFIKFALSCFSRLLLSAPFVQR